MSTIMDSLEGKTKEELIEILKKNAQDNKLSHDMAVLLGSHGVSPSYLNKYTESIEKIKEYEQRQK